MWLEDFSNKRNQKEIMIETTNIFDFVDFIDGRF